MRLQEHYKQLSDFCEWKGIENTKKYYFTKYLMKNFFEFNNSISIPCTKKCTKLYTLYRKSYSAIASFLSN